ncbi:carbohydrate binding domain-containing protein [Luedemannella flava]
MLLSNDFESTYTPWGARGPVTLALADEAHGGSHSLSVTGRTDNWNGPATNATDMFRAGGTYNVTGWVKLPAGTEGSAGVHFTVQRTPADGSSNSYDWIGGSVATTAGTWVQIGGSYTFPAGVSDASLYVEAEGTTRSCSTT